MSSCRKRLCGSWRTQGSKGVLKSHEDRGYAQASLPPLRHEGSWRPPGCRPPLLCSRCACLRVSPEQWGHGRVQEIVPIAIHRPGPWTERKQDNHLGLSASLKASHRRRCQLQQLNSFKACHLAPCPASARSQGPFKFRRALRILAAKQLSFSWTLRCWLLGRPSQAPLSRWSYFSLEIPISLRESQASTCKKDWLGSLFRFWQQQQRCRWIWRSCPGEAKLSQRQLLFRSWVTGPHGFFRNQHFFSERVYLTFCFRFVYVLNQAF